MALEKPNLLQRIPDWKQMLNTVGRKGIVSNIPFILYCSFLAIIYITLNHFAENTIRDINRTAKQLKEYRWKFIDEKTQIMYLTKESQLEKGVASMGLEKTKVPPQKIQVRLTTTNENQ
jgi:hypothetical protein